MKIQIHDEIFLDLNRSSSWKHLHMLVIQGLARCQCNSVKLYFNSFFFTIAHACPAFDCVLRYTLTISLAAMEGLQRYNFHGRYGCQCLSFKKSPLVLINEPL